jgi:hypothetical protein
MISSFVLDDYYHPKITPLPERNLDALAPVKVPPGTLPELPPMIPAPIGPPLPPPLPVTAPATLVPSFHPIAVPEPSSVILFASGLFAACLWLALSRLR